MNTLITIFLPAGEFTYGTERAVKFLYPPLADIFASVSVPANYDFEEHGATPLRLRFGEVVIPDQETIEVIAGGNSLLLYSGKLYTIDSVRTKPNDFAITLLATETTDYSPEQFVSLTVGNSMLVTGDDILGVGDQLSDSDSGGTGA